MTQNQIKIEEKKLRIKNFGNFGGNIDLEENGICETDVGAFKHSEFGTHLKDIDHGGRIDGGAVGEIQRGETRRLVRQRQHRSVADVAAAGLESKNKQTLKTSFLLPHKPFPEKREETRSIEHSRGFLAVRLAMSESKTFRQNRRSSFVNELPTSRRTRESKTLQKLSETSTRCAGKLQLTPK